MVKKYEDKRGWRYWLIIKRWPMRFYAIDISTDMWKLSHVHQRQSSFVNTWYMNIEFQYHVIIYKYIYLPIYIYTVYGKLWPFLITQKLGFSLYLQMHWTFEVYCILELWLCYEEFLHCRYYYTATRCIKLKPFDDTL